MTSNLVYEKIPCEFTLRAMNDEVFKANSERVRPEGMSRRVFLRATLAAERRFWRAERPRSLRLHPQAMIPVSALVAICQSTDLDLARCG